MVLSITKILGFDEDENVARIQTRFQIFNFEEFDASKLFAYHKSWYCVVINVLDSVPIHCDAKLTEEEADGLATLVSECYPTVARRETNRELVDAFLNKLQQ
jgi:hypothetical protein